MSQRPQRNVGKEKPNYVVRLKITPSPRQEPPYGAKHTRHPSGSLWQASSQERQSTMDVFLDANDDELNELLNEPYKTPKKELQVGAVGSTTVASGIRNTMSLATLVNSASPTQTPSSLDSRAQRTISLTTVCRLGRLLGVADMLQQDKVGQLLTRMINELDEELCRSWKSTERWRALPLSTKAIELNGQIRGVLQMLEDGRERRVLERTVNALRRDLGLH